GFSDRRVFIVTMCLTGDDLPIAVALKPRVSDVIARFEILTEDCLALGRVITEHGSVPNDPAVNVMDLDRSGVSSRQRCEVGDQLWLSEKASFLVGKHAIVCEMFSPRGLVAGHQRIVQLLSASDQFVLCNGNVFSADDRCSGHKTNERELHKKG